MWYLALCGAVVSKPTIIVAVKLTRESVFHKLYYHQPAIEYADMDFYTGKAEVDRDEREHVPPEPRNVWESKLIPSSGGEDVYTDFGYRDLVCDCVRMGIYRRLCSECFWLALPVTSFHVSNI